MARRDWVFPRKCDDASEQLGDSVKAFMKMWDGLLANHHSNWNSLGHISPSTELFSS
jgi:hypothetical protein